jgi:DNA ligase-1
MMLAGRFTGKQNVNGWLMSEKLDGCRAFWDGEILRTRSWLPILAPSRITDGLPKGIALDGELWGGRGTFERVRVAVQFRNRDHADWDGVNFWVFDAPSTSAIPLEKRLANAERLANAANVQFCRQIACNGGAMALAEMGKIVSEGGEGLVLRRPGSFYTFGRSCDWLKVKPGE